MNWVFAIALGGALLAAGCGKSAEERASEERARAAAAAASAAQARIAAEKDLHAKLQEKIAATLIDPGSAQFRHVRSIPGVDAICGEINGKNRFGGYVGFRLFWAAPDQTLILNEPWMLHALARGYNDSWSYMLGGQERGPKTAECLTAVMKGG